MFSLSYSEENISCFDTAIEAGQFLQNFVESGDILLVKGSQDMRLEKVVEQIMRHSVDDKGEVNSYSSYNKTPWLTWAVKDATKTAIKDAIGSMVDGIHDAFKSLVAAMDVVTCVSFSETFCIVAADAAVQSVPLVTSAQIPWASRHSRADPNDAESIADAMFHAWHWRWATRIFDPNRAGLARYSDESRRIWLRYLEGDHP